MRQGNIAMREIISRDPVSHQPGGILFLGDTIIGHPPGTLGFVPKAKLDNPLKLKQSLRKLHDLDF